MTYEELLKYSARALGARVEGEGVNLFNVIRVLQVLDGTNRLVAAEILCRFMAEFIEGQVKPLVPGSKPH